MISISSERSASHLKSVSIELLLNSIAVQRKHVTRAVVTRFRFSDVI